MNVDEVVEPRKQPFNEILTHIQFSLHALAEDLRQTESAAFRATFSPRIKRLETKFSAFTMLIFGKVKAYQKWCQFLATLWTVNQLLGILSILRVFRNCRDFL